VFGKLSQYSDDLARAIGEPFEFLSYKNTKYLLAQGGAELKNALRSLGVNPEVHHIIEGRFAKIIGKEPGEILSVVLPDGLHDVFTAAWRDAIGYVGDKVETTTANATVQKILEAAKIIYKNYPELLEATQKMLF
jgi:hypothetical protein